MIEDALGKADPPRLGQRGGLFMAEERGKLCLPDTAGKRAGLVAKARMLKHFLKKRGLKLAGRDTQRATGRAGR